MAIAAAPAAAEAAGAVTGGRAAAAGAAKKSGGAGGAAARKGAPEAPGLPERGSWRQRSQQDGKGGGGKKSGAGSALLKGDAGRARKMMIAEFIICIVLLGLSPLAKSGADQMGPIRFMKRGSATCAMFIVLGLVSSGGKGAARAAAMFGALVTLVLLVDQREAFGKLAKTLNSSKDDDAKDAADLASGVGPDDSTAATDDPGVAAT
jgi:hypothetical protein